MSTPTIAGVTLEQYAELCAAMAETGGDEAKELEIAGAAGVGADAWREAKAGFTAKMQDPADMGKTAMAFMPLYQAAQEKARGGGPPCSLELYAEISTSYSFELDEHGEQVPPELIFQRHGISAAKWNEYTGYWTPRVNDPEDPVSQEFPKLVQAESDRIFGIHRDASGSRVEPDDEDASDEDRRLAREAMANARRPTDENPSARSPGAGPVTRKAPPAAPAAAAPASKSSSPKPVAPPKAASMPAPVSKAPPPVASAPPPPPPEEDGDFDDDEEPTGREVAAVASKPAKPGSAAETEGEEEPTNRPTPKAKPRSAAPAPPTGPVDPTKVPNLTEQEKMWAAGCHAAAILGLAIWVPLVVWLLFKNDPEKSRYVAHHAQHAFFAQLGAFVVLMIVSIITCGLGTFLLFPWMAFEGYVAYLAFEGKKATYPGLPAFEGEGGGKTF